MVTVSRGEIQNHPVPSTSGTDRLKRLAQFR
jgi:hypothetical protein